MFSMLAEAVSVTIPTPDLSAVSTGGWIGMALTAWYSAMVVMFRRSWTEGIVQWGSEGRRTAATMSNEDWTGIVLAFIGSPLVIPWIGASRVLSKLIVKAPKTDKGDKV